MSQDLSSFTGVRIARDNSVLTLGANQDIVLVRTDKRTAYFLGDIRFQDGDVKTLKEQVKKLTERLNNMDGGGPPKGGGGGDIKVGG